MQKCASGKRAYLTNELAEEALIQAWVSYNYSSTSGPRAVYKCDDCGYYHFTSRGEVNKKLQQYIDEGNIKRMKEANLWEGKIKKR